MKNYGLLLLGLWLITRSLLELFNFHFSYDHLVLACIALAAGILFFVYELKTKLQSIGMVLLGIWLITGAAMALFKFTFPSSQLIMGKRLMHKVSL